MTLPVRSAISSDAKKIAEYLQKLHEMNISYMSNLPFDFEKTVKSVRHVIAHPWQAAWVVDKGDGIEGILMAVAWDSWYSKKREASDLIFYVDETARGYGIYLMRMFILWARKKKIQNISATNTMREHDPKVDEFYERLGFKKIADYYLLEKINERSSEGSKEGS